MITLELRNRQLQKILLNITNLIFDPNVESSLSNFAEERPLESDELYPGFHPTSEEYLKDAIKGDLKSYGFPRLYHMISWDNYKRKKDHDPFYKFPEISFKLAKQISIVQQIIGAERNALAAFYPPKGYLSWHHNGNAPGYNIIMSYSKNGEGSFSWLNDSDEIVENKDVPGWNIKAGYYGSLNNANEKLFWHMAKTNEPRLTLGFVMDYEKIWSGAIETIERVR